MSASLLIAGASLLFAVMGLCVKLASAHYAAGEIVMARGLVGVVFVALLARRLGVSLATALPAMHFWRSATGVVALSLWFTAIGGTLPLATAMTLNYMSSVWMALFLVGGAVLAGHSRVDGRLVGAVLAGFAGVALVLKPTINPDQLGYGLAGLASGLLAALAYLQVQALGRAGEPELRVVFWFSTGGVLAGALIAWGGPATGLVPAVPPGEARWSPAGLGLLLAIGVLATVAQLMMTRAYAIGQTLANAALQYLGILFSFVFGVWIFGDPVTLPAIAGMLLIVVAGLAATFVGRVRKAPAAQTPSES